ncbi:MAG: lsrD [Marmoricola sp.]|nr:lsrD [Marmoricola sp.]
MTISDKTAEAATSRSTAPNGSAAGARASRRRIGFGFNKFSGLYLWAIVIVFFAIRLPQTFGTTQNFKIMAGDQAITAMVALALILPVAAGVFDLSVAANVGFCVCVVTRLQMHGMSAPIAILMTLFAGALVGVVNGFVVVRLEVDSFIATLGMSSILAAGAYWITGGQQLVGGVSQKFLNLGQNTLWGISYPFYYMLVLSLVLYIIVEHTPVGRYLFAVGGNMQAARLTGLRVDRVRAGALICSSALAGLVGVILAASLGSASQDVGPPYLLAAFSAVFLGTTQIRPGRANVVGTLIAVYLLATGVKGLQLSGAPVWVNGLFNGVALIFAVALAARGARRQRASNAAA